MINPASLFFNSANANSLDVVQVLRVLSDALDAVASKIVDRGREGDPGILLDQGTGKT